MSRIDLQIVGTANFAQIEAALTRLRSQLSTINSMQLTGVIPANAQGQLNNYLQTFRDTIDASGMYQRQLVSITNETEKFGRGLERGNLRLGQLYRSAMDYRRTEIGQIRQLAREQIRLQNSIALTRGDGMAEVFSPRGIDEGIEKHRILSQEYRILRQVIRNGSTELINWGKNTQWAGRQLTVGLTVPITIFGAAAAKAFMDADKQLTRLAKVYGDTTKGMVSSTEIQQIRSQALGLAQDIAAGMGVSVEETLGIAADIAATGKEGNELLGATREAMRLSVLGEVDRQEAMRATLAIQTVFKQSTEGLTDSINFLNAVENQTSTSLNDLVTGIVKAGPVVQGLGGDIEDLALMMVAMREGGVPASEAANAIKSSLASLINPTKQTTQVLSDFGINLREIVDNNAGDVIGTLVTLQSELEGLDELSRQRSIEQIFGKFQFSRINALLNNLNKAGSQTEQVMALAELGTAQLAETAQKELEAVTESVTGRFARAFEALKANLIPIGETFTVVGTILLEVGTKILEVFNSLPEPVQNFFKLLAVGTAVVGPLIMITGVLGNFFGYLVKGMSTLMLFKKEGREAFRLITPESVATRKATDVLTDSLFNQTLAIDNMGAAIDTLVQKLEILQQSLRDAANAPTLTNQEVLARAEATSASAYTTPQVPIRRRYSEAFGFEEANVQYSHLLASSAMKGVPGLGARGEATLGLGTFVQGRVAELQGRLKDMVVDLLAIPTEAMATPEARRAELERLARGHHKGNVEELTKTMDIINSLTDQELAQILPSWEKISKQTSMYTGTLSAAAKAVESGNAEAGRALQQFKKDVEDFGPEEALRRLQQSLREAGVAVDQEIVEVERLFDQVASDVRNVAPGEQRALATFNRLVGYDPTTGQTSPESVVGRETRAQTILDEAKIAGYSKQSGFNKVMMLASQSLTDEYFNEANMSEQMQQAYLRNINSKRRLEAADKAQESASQKKAAADRSLADATRNAENKLKAAYTTPKDLSTAQRRDSDQRWMIEGQVVGTKQKELIAALDAREAAMAAASSADLEYKNSVKELVRAQDGDRRATAKLEAAKEAETEALKRSTQQEKESTVSSERNQQAEEQDTRETLNSAKSEKQDADASRRLAAAEAADARATGGSARSQRGGIMGALTRGGGRLSGLGAGLGSALSMATMFIPTGDNEGLNTATNILGGAGMGASMGAMAGAPGAIIGGIVGAAIPAITAYVDAQQKVNDELVRYSQSLSGAAGVIEGFGEELGRRSPTERLNEAIAGLKIPQEAQQAAQSILESATGQKLLSGARAMSGEQRESALLNQLKQLTLSEIFTAEEAKAVAQELAIELGDPSLGRSLVEGIVSIIDSEGKLISDAISQQFIDTLPNVEEILKRGASVSPPLPTPAAADQDSYGRGEMGTLIEENQRAVIEAARIRAGETDRIKATMSLLAGDLKQIAEAQAMVKLSFQQGEITLDQYNSQMSQLSDISSTAYSELKRLIEMGSVNFVGANSILGDIASAQGVTDEFDKVVAKAEELTSMLGTGDMFRVPLETAAAYGQLAESELKNFQDIITANPEIQTKVSAIFDEPGSEEFALEIIKLINAGMDATQLETIIKTEGAEEGIKLIDTFNLTVASLPTEIQTQINSQINYDPAKMNEFIADYDYINSLPNSNKELRAEIFGNDELVEIQENWKAFTQLSDTEKKTAIISAIYNVEYNYATPAAPAPVPVEEVAVPSAEEMTNAVFNQSGGGGGSDAASKAIDKKIEQQDKIIKQIQKEREERQKLLDLEKQALDFAFKQQDLENQIAKAKAEGRLADAALLQSRLDAEVGDQEAQERERLRQEEEDKRIKRAEREKKRLEREKEKLSGGGGGGGGGSDEAAINAMQKRLQFLNDELQVALQGNKDILDAIYTEGASGFWDSEPIKRYIREATKAGVPLEIVRAELEKVFDLMVSEGFKEFPLLSKMRSGLEDVGVAGEGLNQVLPNIFAAFNDPSMDEDEFLKYVREQFRLIGMNADEAKDRAEDFYKTIPSYDRKVRNSLNEFNDAWETVQDQFDERESEIIATKFAEGIRRGATKREILDNISSEIYKAIYTEGIDNALDPVQASKDAWDMAMAVKTKTSQEMKDFEVDVPYRATYDDSDLPSYLRDAAAAADRGPVGTPTWSVNHTVNSTISLSRGNNAYDALWVKIAGGSSNGGPIGRGTGGMIYGPGGPTSDIIPTMLSNGEYVIRAASVQKYGIPFLDMVNKGMLPMMGKGGYSKYPSMVNGMAMGGGVYYNRGGVVTETSNNVEYNINVNVAGSNASPDEIANKVIQTIKRSENMRGTGIRA